MSTSTDEIQAAAATLQNPLWGVFLSVGLFGIIASQAWVYGSKNNDSWYMHAFVAFLVLLDFVNVVLEAEMVNYYFLQNYADPISLLAFPKYLAIQGLLTVIATLSVQLFFASRVYFLYERSYVRTGVIILAALAAFVPGLLMCIDMYVRPSLQDISSVYRKTTAGAFSGLSVSCDLVTTSMLSLKLFHVQTRVKSNVLQKLIIYIITRGFLISAVHLVNMILYVARSDTMDWTITYFCLSRVCVLTMLTMLNSRYELQGRFQQDNDVGIDLSSIVGLGTRERARQGIIDINVQTVQLVIKDGGTTTTESDKDMQYSAPQLALSELDETV